MKTTNVKNTIEGKTEEMNGTNKAMWKIAAIAFVASASCQLFARVNMEEVVDQISNFFANLPM